MFVLVHLEKPKRRIIVPESFVHNLDQERLKNAGKNRNVTYSVYWAKEALGDENSAPNLQWIPNFNAPLSEKFPPNDGVVEACYAKSRIIRFFQSFDDAKSHRDKYRPLMPAVYNVGRLVEMPAPILVQANVECDTESSIEQQNDQESVNSNDSAEFNLEYSSTNDTLNENALSDGYSDQLDTGNDSLNEEGAEHSTQTADGNLASSSTHNSLNNAENARSGDSTDQLNTSEEGAEHTSHTAVMASDNPSVNEPLHEQQVAQRNDNNNESHVDHETANVSPSTEIVSVHSISDIVTSVALGEQVPVDSKNVFGHVEVNANNDQALNTLFEIAEIDNDLNGNETGEEAGNNNIPLNLSTVIGLLKPNETAAMNENGQKIVTKTEDWGTITYVWNEEVRPKSTLYEVKLNDMISGNIPFKQDPFSTARKFLVRIDGRFREILFSATLVNGLKLLNAPGSRNNVAQDKRFVKGLIISICGADKIRSGETINKDLYKFFKELFVIRIGDDDDENSTRYMNFANLVNKSCEEIKQDE